MTLDATLGPVAIELSAPDLLLIVRAFALEQLRETGELEAAEQQLAEYIRGLVEQVDPTPVSVGVNIGLHLQYTFSCTVKLSLLLPLDFDVTSKLHS